MDSLVIEGCAVATVDGTADGVITTAGTGTEYESGHVVLQGGRISAVGAGPAPAVEGARVVDAGGRLATPGLIGTHHHLFQGLTRGLAQDSGLMRWLTALYPLWAGLDAELHGAAARAGLVTLALSGCSATADHHYLFPRGGGLLAAGIDAARQIELRLHACRGSLDLGTSAGGLPPDSVVEDRDEILAATERAIEAFHDSGPAAMVRVAVAPCAPFTVTGQLMRESAELARRKGVRLHTHLAETNDEHDFCLERFGCTLAARARQGAAAFSARQALAAATMGGARCLGRQDEIGSLEVGKQADVAVWRLDDLGHAAIADPVWALVCGPPARLELLTVGGLPVVEAGRLCTADLDALNRDVRAAARALTGRHRAGR